MATSVIQFFDSEAGDYRIKHYAPDTRSFIGRRYVRILEFIAGLQLRPGARVLDAGCGPGILTAELTRRGYRVDAIDLSSGMVTAARQAAPGATCILGSVEHMPYPDNTFDLVVSAGVVEYLASDSALLTECARVLKPGAAQILSTTRRWALLYMLDPLVERAKRNAPALALLNSLQRVRGKPPVRPRHFRVRTHSAAELRRSIQAAGLTLEREASFHHRAGILTLSRKPGAWPQPSPS